MLIIPAIDLKDGACVRLRQGLMEDATVFSDDPVAMAAKWVDGGCRRLHLVDLNGAFEGKPVNGEVVTAIARRYPDLPIQIGGGIRSLETIEHYVRAGVSYVIIGTKAVKQPEFVGEACRAFPGKVIVGLDAKDGFVATDGWAEVSEVQVIDLARRFEADGVSAIVYTDISKDGMMQGCNVEATAALANATRIPVIASGGIHNLGDIQKLLDARTPGIIGAITGRAIYEGTLDVAKPRRCATTSRPEANRMALAKRIIPASTWTTAEWSRASSSRTSATPATRSRSLAATTSRVPTRSPSSISPPASTGATPPCIPSSAWLARCSFR